MPFRLMTSASREDRKSSSRKVRVFPAAITAGRSGFFRACRRICSCTGTNFIGTRVSLKAACRARSASVIRETSPIRSARISLSAVVNRSWAKRRTHFSVNFSFRYSTVMLYSPPVEKNWMDMHPVTMPV